jgi:hypothetical protein
MKHSLIYVLLVAIIGLFGVAFSQHQEKTELQQQILSLTRENSAHLSLIHRIWIDDPTYFDDVVSETEEYEILNSLRKGDWEDTFLFWDKTDSVSYIRNQK